MKKITLLLSFLISFNYSFSQNKSLTVEDAVLKGKTSLAPAKLSQLSWIPGTSNYSFSEKSNEDEFLYSCEASSGKKIILTGNKQLADDIKKIDGKLALTKFPAIKWLNTNEFYFTFENQVFVKTLNAGVLKKVNSYEKEAENIDLNEKTLIATYTKENNLFISQNGSAVQVTNESNPGIVNGQAAHRNEFAINKGTFWSPSGNLLAYYRMDESMVTEYPILDLETKPAKPKMIRYPMAGMKSHEVTIGIYNLSTKQTIFLNTGEPKEQYLTNITWSTDEKTIYVAVLNREQNHMKLNQYDAATGSLVKTLFEEQDSKYVEPEHGPIFIEGTDKFIWFSKRDGYNHLYLYNTKGENLGQLTKGEWLVTDFIGLDASKNTFYFQSTKESPIERHIYSCNLKSRKIAKLTEATGTHGAIFNEKGDLFIDTYNSTSIPRNSDLVKSDGKKIRNILTAENPLKDYQLGEMKLFTIKSSDNSDLYCRMILPPGFNENKKYPVLVYQYGGPHVQLVNNTWLGGADLWLHYMAEQGYVVFTLDNHGSGNRGQKFEQATFRNLGEFEIADQLKGVEYLKSLKYTDTTRMGIFGWSFGGFMTTTMMTKHPFVFKAAVAGGPVINWNYYEVMYTERYMDTPQENPEGYEKNNLLNYAGKLQGKLLMIHGSSDDVVVMQHSLLFLKKCVESGTAIDYFVYPEHKHNVLGPDRVHLMKKVTEYMNTNVKGSFETTTLTSTPIKN